MKRLVVCCDGTWQRLDNPYPTNVLKLAQAIRLVGKTGINQIVHYDNGIGTGDVLDRYGGGAFGWGIDEKIKEAYQFLSFNYSPGDQVFLFGFSRGAYTVRSLAGLIYNSGLLHRRFAHKTNEAYELYRSRDQRARPRGEDAVVFRQRYGEAIDIDVLGCWDTVGSLGIPEIFPMISDLLNRRYRFYDTQVNPRIVRAFHAVAVDEIREAFDYTPMQANTLRESGQVTQVWFPGEHACVGGGVETTRGLSDAVLLWMLEQVQPLGLEVDPEQIALGLEPSHTTPFDNQPKGVFRLTGSRIRNIHQPFNALHTTVKRRWKDIEEYEPKSLKPFEQDLDNWNDEAL